MSAGSDRAAELANASDITGALQPFLCAAELVIHQRQLEAEGCRFGVDSVAATNARGEPVFVRPASNHLAQFLDVGDEEGSALNQLQGKRRVHDIAAGKAEMEPAA